MALIPYSNRVTTQRGGRRGDRDGDDRRERRDRPERDEASEAPAEAATEFAGLDEGTEAAATESTGGEQ
jgi:hypothetical protein